MNAPGRHRRAYSSGERKVRLALITSVQGKRVISQVPLFKTVFIIPLWVTSSPHTVHGRYVSERFAEAFETSVRSASTITMVVKITSSCFFHCSTVPRKRE